MAEIVVFGIGLVAKVLKETLPVRLFPGIGALIRGYLVPEGRVKETRDRRFGGRL